MVALNRPLISICIPTYNRCDYLKVSMDSYIRDPEFKNGNVEVIVSDNASTDDTYMYMMELVKKYPNIRYYRNEENIRDENFPLVLSKGKGILHWLRNDTIECSPNGLTYCCDLVKKYQKTKPIIFFCGMAREQLPIGESCYDSIDDFLRGAGYYITWIAGLSVWHEDCENIAEDTDGCEMFLWQVRKLVDLLMIRKRGIISRYDFGRVQFVKKRDISYGRFKVHYGYYFKILKRYSENGAISQSCIEYLERDLLYGNLTDFMLQIDCNEDKNLVYEKGEQQHLKEQIFSQYKSKAYFDDYLKYYKKRLFWLKLKKNFFVACFKKVIPNKVLSCCIQPVMNIFMHKHFG